MQVDMQQDRLPASVDFIDIPVSTSWPRRGSWQLRGVRLLADITPRGKGAIPRWIGRNALRHMQCSIQTATGAWLAVNPLSLDVYTSILRNGGEWDFHVLQTCLKFLRRGQVFYDIGANAGYMSISVGHHFNDEVTVCAFEPQPDLCRSIALSAALNQLRAIRILEVMLGEQRGQATLYIPSHSIHASAISREKDARELRRHVLTLDELVHNGTLPPPDVIKIDVEGAEMAVFRGAATTIRQVAPTIIFEADDNLLRFDYAQTDLMTYLRELADYAFFQIQDTGDLKPVEPADDLPRANFAAVPRTKMSDH